MLPIRKEKTESSDEITESSKVLTNLTEQFFVGDNEEILKTILAEFSFENANQFFETIFTLIGERIDLESLNHTNIEELDLISLAKDIAGSIEYKGQLELSDGTAEKFEDALKQFGRSTLHDVAFPMMALENPNVALSAKNLVKRTISSLQQEEDIDLSKLYEELDIENLPTEFSTDLFLRLGGSFPGIEQTDVVEINENADNEPTILHCELSIEQAVYLAHVLKEDYAVIKNWKAFFNLLKSNGKKYDNVIVYSDKIGLLLSVISAIHERKTITDGKYLYTNKGNGLWPFFQEFLIDSKTDQPFKRKLRQLRSENARDDEAKEIVDVLFDQASQNKIIQTAKEITKK